MQKNFLSHTVTTVLHLPLLSKLNMSGFTSSSSSNNIKTEIVRLVESQKEKASLLAYFTKYQDQQTEVFSDLSNFEADEDLVTLRLSCLVCSYRDYIKV